MIFKKAEDGNEILSLWMVICAAVKGQSNAQYSPLSAAWMEVYRGLGDAECVQKGRNFRK